MNSTDCFVTIIAILRPIKSTCNRIVTTKSIVLKVAARRTEISENDQSEILTNNILECILNVGIMQDPLILPAIRQKQL